MIVCDRCKEPGVKRDVHVTDTSLIKLPHEALRYDLCEKCYTLIVSAVDMIVKCLSLELKFDRRAWHKKETE